MSSTSSNEPSSSNAHDEAHDGGGHIPELENFWNLLAASPLNSKEHPVTQTIIKPFDPYVEDSNEATLHKTNQNIFFSLVTIVLIIWVARRFMRKRALIPDRKQSLVEVVIEGLYNFFLSILGEKHGHRYVPFLMALFLFILINNLMGIVPFMKSSTNAFQCNIVLGLSVFFYVQYTGLRYSGPKNYLLHLLGNPQGAIMWILSPLMFLLHVIGELVKPISLSLRLFGNIMGEDVLLGAFAMMGIMLTAFALKPIGVEHPLVGIPLHLPFIFLAALTSTIQALVFSTLSCIYILLMLPHDDQGH